MSETTQMQRGDIHRKRKQKQKTSALQEEEQEGIRQVKMPPSLAHLTYLPSSCTLASISSLVNRTLCNEGCMTNGLDAESASDLPFTLTIMECDISTSHARTPSLFFFVISLFSSELPVTDSLDAQTKA